MSVPRYHHYYAYGLRIRSCLALPGLGEAPQETDPQNNAVVTIRMDEIAPLPCEQRGMPQCRHATPESIAFYFKDVGRFLIRGGTDISVQPAPGVTEDVLRIYILGVCFGAVLHQRGFLVLHASAIALHGQVAVFMGHKGQGKSTMAAALHAHGHSIVSDDVVPAQLTSEGNPQVYPGLPQLRLWPDAVIASLGIDPESLPLVHPDFEKRIPNTNHAAPSDEPMPLAAVYVLGRAEEISIDPLRRQEAFVELVRYSYAARVLEGTKTSRQHFEQCADLARRVPVFRLSRPRDLSMLADVARFVERQVTEHQMLAL